MDMMSDVSVNCRDTVPGKHVAANVIGLVFGIIGFLFVVYAMYALIFESFTSVPINFAAYHAWLEKISWSTGLGMMALVLSFLFLISGSRAFIAMLFLISILLGLGIVLWVNYFRPVDTVMLFNINEYSRFKNLITSMEILVAALFITGVVSELRFQYTVSSLCPERNDIDGLYAVDQNENI